YAIHNHGLEEKRYPSVERIYDQIKDLDPRVGICHDIGYSAQMGFDPAAVTLKYGHRIYEMHIKDMTSGSAEGTDCEVGRGIIDFPSLVKALRKTKYSGVCSIELEKNNTDPLPGIAESAGYFKGVMKAT
ncbi:MAG TPA: sugar phosphate isomerase/epimerase, partial [Chitinophagaceae bacterium]